MKQYKVIIKKPTGTKTLKWDTLNSAEHCKRAAEKLGYEAEIIKN